MHTALAAGQSLSVTRIGTLFTPLHTAALNGSTDFLREALLQPSANPWARDSAGRTALDHAEARRDIVGMKLLYAAMYAGGANPFRGDENESPDEPTPY